MLDLTSRISQHLLLTCRRNRRPGKMKWTIQVTMIHVAICQWTMRICRRLKANTQNRFDDDPIELDTGGDPPSQPPGGGTQVPVPGGEHDDSDLDMPMDSEDTGGNPPPGAGPQGGPGYGPSRFLRSIMTRLLLQEVRLGSWGGSSVC
eukprot:s9076_g2.t1